MLFAERDVQESRGRQHIHGQSAVPQRNAEPQMGLALEVDLVPVDGHLEDAFHHPFIGVKEK